MANFDANIDLIVNSSAALRGVQKVERAFEKLNKQAASFAEIFGSSKVDRALTNTVKQTVAIGILHHVLAGGSGHRERAGGGE